MQELAEISKAALALTLDERTILANRLAESLHSESDPETEQAWKEEIRRRVEEVRSGKVELIDGEVAMKQLRERFGQ